MKKRNLFLTRLLLLITFLVIALAVWTGRAEADVHYMPDYEKIDLQDILQKEYLEVRDYEVLLRQTGLGRLGVDELWGQERQEELLFLQQRFFAPIEYECRRRWVLYHSERVIQETRDETRYNGEDTNEVGEHGNLEEAADHGDFLPTVRTGDILITFNGHFLGWRSGHAGIVTDAEKGEVLEAMSLGTESRICALEHWREYPSFILLRLKNTGDEKRLEIGKYAGEKLLGIPYRLLSLCGIEGEGTQCAYLVWSAYRFFGYNLDSDGGFVVTPYDIYQSDLLEIVQVYGVKPGNCP